MQIFWCCFCESSPPCAVRSAAVLVAPMMLCPVHFLMSSKQLADCLPLFLFPSTGMQVFRKFPEFRRFYLRCLVFRTFFAVQKNRIFSFQGHFQGILTFVSCIPASTISWMTTFSRQVGLCLMAWKKYISFLVLISAISVFFDPICTRIQALVFFSTQQAPKILL